MRKVAVDIEAMPWADPPVDIVTVKHVVSRPSPVPETMIDVTEAIIDAIVEVKQAQIFPSRVVTSYLRAPTFLT